MSPWHVLTSLLFFFWIIIFLVNICSPPAWNYAIDKADTRASRREHAFWAVVYALLTVAFLYNIWSILVICAGGLVALISLDLSGDSRQVFYRALVVFGTVVIGLFLLLTYGWTMLLTARRARMLWMSSWGATQEEALTSTMNKLPSEIHYNPISDVEKHQGHSGLHGMGEIQQSPV